MILTRCFAPRCSVFVIAATNRPDVLDPALLRSGRLDRKIELPHPSEDARGKIMQIHSRKMNVDVEDVNFEELARCTDDFNAAQLKAVCVEAGMLALRREGTEIKVHVLLFDSPSRTRLTLHFLSAYRSTKILWRVFPRCKPRRRGVSTTMLKCHGAGQSRPGIARLGRTHELFGVGVKRGEDAQTPPPAVAA